VPADSNPLQDLALYRRLFSQARPYRLHIAGLVLLSFLASPLALLVPVPLAIAVDSVVGSRPVPGFLDALLPRALVESDTALLIAASALFVVIAFLTQAHSLGTSLLQVYTGEKLVLGFRGRIFNQVQRLSISYHDKKGTADSTYRIQYDALSIQKVVVDALVTLLTSAFTIGGMLYVIALIDGQLALIALAVCPILLTASWRYRSFVRPRWREAKKLESSALSVVQEVLTGLRVVKAFGQEDREQGRFVSRSNEGLLARVRLTLIQNMFGLLIGLTTALGTGLVLFVGVRHVQSGAMTLGELVLVMGYLTQLYKPLEKASRKAASLQSALVSAERAFTLLDHPPDVPERPHARHLARAAGRVRFEAVSFAYEGEHPVLEDVSFEVAPGVRLGIAGTTGAGKSTLVSLLTRFYDPTAGRVLLDGVDLRDYRVADLRAQFAIVLQEPVLFSTSIGENIAYADPGADPIEIVNAARAAGAHGFVTRLPHGYDTQVGERGMRLSGGERQRISLARAFLKNAPILILDEPTSSVDTRTEATIMEAMSRLMDGRTTFMIAHRLSTLEGCDTRMQVEGGRIADLQSTGQLGAVS
jgi:ATP-binding cassette, subfamily B, bacterial